MGCGWAISNALIRYDALWPTELEYPIHTASARSEALALSGDYDSNQLLMACCDHRGNGAHLSMDVVAPKAVLNVTASENGAILSDCYCADGGLAEEVGIAPYSPSQVKSPP
jgi:hypothetical protein